MLQSPAPLKRRRSSFQTPSPVKEDLNGRNITTLKIDEVSDVSTSLTENFESVPLLDIAKEGLDPSLEIEECEEASVVIFEIVDLKHKRTGYRIRPGQSISDLLVQMGYVNHIDENLILKGEDGKVFHYFDAFSSLDSEQSYSVQVLSKESKCAQVHIRKTTKR